MKVHEIAGIRLVEGADIGIEIEVEGENLPTGVPKYWKVVPDGSLRDGLEYVYKRPMNILKIEETLDELADTFIKAEAELDFSFRTSVHVHINCTGLEYYQLLNYIYTYFLLEDILVDFCGEGRKGNRFCLRLQDADGSLEIIERLFKSPGRIGEFRIISRDMVRYAALNVEALKKFGTLEFRSMRGTINKDLLIPWVESLYHIRQYSMGFKSAKDIFDRLEEIGERQFFQEAIGKHYELFDNGKIETSIGIGRSLSITLPFTEPAIGGIYGIDPMRVYRINGEAVRMITILERFGDDIPNDIIEQIERQDREAILRERGEGRGIFDGPVPVGIIRHAREGIRMEDFEEDEW